jgi:hypothetical protein
MGGIFASDASATPNPVFPPLTEEEKKLFDGVCLVMFSAYLNREAIALVRGIDKSTNQNVALICLVTRGSDDHLIIAPIAQVLDPVEAVKRFDVEPILEDLKVLFNHKG